MHLIKNRKILSNKLLPLLIITFIWLVADIILEFVFPTHLEHLGKSYLEIGFLLSLASLGGIIVDLPVGNLSDKANRKKLMIAGLTLSLIATIFIFSFKGDLYLTLAFLFWGAAYQVWKVPRDAKFASQTQQVERAEEYGMDMEIKYLAQTVGAFLGGFILLALGLIGTLSFYSIFVIIAIILLYFQIVEKRKKPVFKTFFSSKKSTSIFSQIKKYRLSGLILLLFFSLLFTAWEEILWAFQPLFYGANVLNIPPHLGGVLLAFFSLPGIFLSYPAGRLADRIGKKKVLLVGMSLIGIALILFSLTHQLILVFALALLISIGWSISLPSLNGLIIDHTPDKKGEIVGLWDFFMDVGFVIGPIVGGVIAQFLGVRSVFLCMGILFLVSVLYLYSQTFFKHLKLKEQ